MTRLLMLLCWIVAIVLFAASPGRAVIITTGDGSGNVTPPADDPGWENIGTRNTGLTVIYLGNSWVLTANHVGAGPVLLAGKTYAAIPDSEVRLLNRDSTESELLLFRINGLPQLAFLPITTAPPAVNAVVTLIGAGANRGPATSWTGYTGYYWGSGNSMRWGTAPVAQTGVTLYLGGSATRSFTTSFTGWTPYPAQGAVGDSGGAVFTKVYGAWTLAGVMTAVDAYGGQPAGTSLYNNHTWAADLSYYHEQIEEVVAPDCGLGFELAAVLPPLLWIHGRRRRAASLR